MKKIVIALVAVLILLGGGGGGAYFYFFKMKHHETHATLSPPKPIVFAQINDLVVSVLTATPAAAGNGGDASNSSNVSGASNQAFIELSVQFATTDPKAIDSFNALLPIIQAETVNMLMKQSAEQLMNPDTHSKLSLALLAIANGVLDKNQNFTPPNPFTAAYITNIVQQD